jgi:hypothetical protein
MKKKTYPKGHWMGIGIALGLPIGMAMFFIAGMLTGEMSSMFALGPAIGVSMGVAIGAALEEKYKGQIRELTPQEKKRQQRLVLAGLVILVIGALVGLLAFMAFI